MEESLKYVCTVLGWVIWCTFHSALISITITDYMKRKLGDGFRFYRLFYNVASVVTLIPLIYFTRMFRGIPLFSWEGPLVIVQVLLLAISLFLFVFGGRHYNWAQLLGVAQIRAGRTDGSLPQGNPFVVSGLHRIIRHPWYLGGILIVWAQDLSFTTILTNLVIGVYFVIGSFLEERKLVLEFGNPYREYRRTVSMLFPWRWLKRTTLYGWATRIT